MVNFLKISQELLKGLSERQKNIIIRRFGLKTGMQETLQKIGDDFGITRERVRQIESEGLKGIKPKMKNYGEAVSLIENHLKQFGGVRKEDILLEELAETKNKKIQALVNFTMALSETFKRFNEDDHFFTFWTIDENSRSAAKEVIEGFQDKLKEAGKPIPLVFGKEKQMLSFLGISKKIKQNDEGLYGLIGWPEITPRGIKDKAYLALRKVSQPLHFSDISKLLKGSVLQTVHNELIKDARFVLVGRGIYALTEWGYYPGQVKDVISRVLADSKASLSKEEILQKVFKQRMVKENTILLNLNNKKYFVKDDEGRYNVRNA